MGHREIYTGLGGFVAGIAAGATLAGAQDAFQITEGPATLAAPLGILAGAVGLGFAGYFIGRATSPQAPEFVIEP